MPQVLKQGVEGGQWAAAIGPASNVGVAPMAPAKRARRAASPARPPMGGGRIFPCPAAVTATGWSTASPDTGIESLPATEGRCRQQNEKAQQIRLPVRHGDTPATRSITIPPSPQSIVSNGTHGSSTCCPLFGT